jgi:hypothetical protein
LREREKKEKEKEKEGSNDVRLCGDDHEAVQ